MRAERLLPILAGSLRDPVAWHKGRWITRGELLAHVDAVGERLPHSKHALILCADVYYFMVALAAQLLRGRTALLPPTTAPGAVAEIASAWGAYTLDDTMVERVIPETRTLVAIPKVDDSRESVVLFTSGTTGHPAAQAKSWTELSKITSIAQERFGLGATRHNIVATVPAQHSYGLESAVLYAMLGPSTVHAERPLFPEDVRAALASIPAPRVLVTTPVHLSACVRAELAWPSVAMIICATAPLVPGLAQVAEHQFCAPLYEIYGCSETGAIASRRTVTETSWTPYEGIEVEVEGDNVRVRGPHLPRPRFIADLLAVDNSGRFELRGRKVDQIKIGGKRINLAELNRRLIEIDGVDDGFFLIPEEGATRRLAAVVVAPHLGDDEIRACLAQVIDPVFLPRPLVRVSAIERNAAGKVTRTQLMGAIERAGITTAES